MKLTTEPRLEQELKTQLQLEAHEKECAMFRELVHGKLVAGGGNGGISIYGT
jgi:hypothetical protein